MRLQRTTRGPQGRTRAISPIGKTWMNGSTLRVVHRWARRAKYCTRAGRLGGRRWPISSSTSTTPNAEIRIKFDPNDGAWSYVGTDSRSIPVNEPTMNLGFSMAALRRMSSATRSASHTNIRILPAAFSGMKRSSFANSPGHPTSGTRRRRVTMSCANTGGSDQRHGVRSGFDHAVLLSCLLDLERHRHQGE